MTWNEFFHESRNKELEQVSSLQNERGRPNDIVFEKNLPASAQRGGYNHRSKTERFVKVERFEPDGSPTR